MHQLTNDIQIFKSKFQYVRDRQNKHPKSGESNHSAKLKEYQVRQIRLMYRHRISTQRSLAASYNVSRTTINDVIHYRTWKHITPFLEQDEVITATKLHVLGRRNAKSKVVTMVHAILAHNESELIDVIYETDEMARELHNRYPNVIMLGEYAVS